MKHWYLPWSSGVDTNFEKLETVGLPTHNFQEPQVKFRSPNFFLQFDLHHQEKVAGVLYGLSGHNIAFTSYIINFHDDNVIIVKHWYLPWSTRSEARSNLCRCAVVYQAHSQPDFANFRGYTGIVAVNIFVLVYVS